MITLYTKHGMIRSGYNKAELVLDHIGIMTPTRALWILLVALWILLVCYHGAVLYVSNFLHFDNVVHRT